ncbi:MAG: biotin--[acetyl-CoA-carboxylase] ligase [Dysgonamonadaceae bacterium]|jgi:BirA family biotin operon repressor/biotin-[acetyl-CoA-carboxylase] ligase|nr:biotin--[acetyl-CoA-carboxylase] ligase [Dysgonamonadaceae bacterium]
MNILRIDKTPSTNSLLKALSARERLTEGTVLVASDQTLGRGQAGNFWESEPGKNLTFSMLFYPTFLPIKAHFLLSKAISLAVKEVLDNYLDGITIKWPNDIYYLDKKIAGILIENELTQEELSQSIAGIGLNVNQEVFRSKAPNPVSMKQLLQVDLDRDCLLEEMVRGISGRYSDLQAQRHEAIAARYQQSLYRNAGYFPFSDRNGAFRAKIDFVEDNGALVLTTDGGEQRRYFFKEVAYE